MLKAFSTRRNRSRSTILILVCGVFAIAAATQGIGGNSPGLLLAFLSASYFVLAFVHPWRTSKEFLRLVYASLSILIVFALLRYLSAVIVSNLEREAQVLFFNVSGQFEFFAVICLPVLLVGTVGAVVMFSREYRHRTGHRR